MAKAAEVKNPQDRLAALGHLGDPLLQQVCTQLLALL